MGVRDVAVAASALCSSLFVLSQCSLDGLSGGVVDGGYPADGGVVDSSSPLDDGSNPMSDGGSAAGDCGTIADPWMSDDAAPYCGVQTDQRLVCANTVGAVLYATLSYTGARVDTLSSDPSPFDCWGFGDLHRGGNHTWYRTHGDHAVVGWVAGVDLKTSDCFDANPSAGGLPQCDVADP